MSTTAPRDLPSHDHLAAAEVILNDVTDHAGQHEEDPKNTLHTPANAQKSHSWFRDLFPHDSLQDFENAWQMGNYVLDRETGEKTFEDMSIYAGMHRLLYYGSQRQKVLHTNHAKALLAEQSIKMGKQYDDPANVDHIRPFIESFHLESTLSQLKQPDPTQYKNFNEFFARELKPDARPIAEPGNEKVVSSPADCRLTAFPTIDLATKHWIKGFGFSLEKLLDSAELAKRFEGGSICIARLAPQDYHRWHAPVSGKVTGIADIAGTYYTVNPQAINEAGTLDVFCENRRSVMMGERSSTGSPVAIVAVGAMLIGSIKYNPGVEGEAQIERGQCLGAFLYGGSTVIVLYPKGQVELDQDLVRNSTKQNYETLVEVGWRVGAGP